MPSSFYPEKTVVRLSRIPFLWEHLKRAPHFPLGQWVWLGRVLVEG